jgi:hypothetical protein
MIPDLLRKLRDRNVAISLDNNDLKVKFNGALLPDDLMEEIRGHKELLLEYLGRQSGDLVTTKIKPAKRSNCYPLSSSQYILWLLNQIEGGKKAYHLPGAYVFDGNLNRRALERAVDSLLERHEILRTVFREDESGEIRQFINSAEKAGISGEAGGARNY